MIFLHSKILNIITLCSLIPDDPDSLRPRATLPQSPREDGERLATLVVVECTSDETEGAGEYWAGKLKSIRIKTFVYDNVYEKTNEFAKTSSAPAAYPDVVARGVPRNIFRPRYDIVAY